jgi:hypothetical protein
VPVDNTLENDAILDESPRFVLVRVDTGFEIRSTGDRDEPLMRLSAERHDEDQARSAFRRLVRQERLAICLIVAVVVAGIAWVGSLLALDIPGLVSNIPRTFDPIAGETSDALALRDWLLIIQHGANDLFLVAAVLYVILWLQRRWWLERGPT